MKQELEMDNFTKLFKDAWFHDQSSQVKDCISMVNDDAHDTISICEKHPEHNIKQNHIRICETMGEVTAVHIYMICSRKHDVERRVKEIAKHWNYYKDDKDARYHFLRGFKRVWGIDFPYFAFETLCTA